SAFGTFSPQAGRRVSKQQARRRFNRDPSPPGSGEKVPKADEGESSPHHRRNAPFAAQNDGRVPPLLPRRFPARLLAALVGAPGAVSLPPAGHAASVRRSGRFILAGARALAQWGTFSSCHHYQSPFTLG